MIGIKNIVVRSGYSYSKYLKAQLAAVQENIERQKDYNANDLYPGLEINFGELDENGQPKEMDVLIQDAKDRANTENLQRYTRCGGHLFDEWNLSGYLTEDKIDLISKLELGHDDRTTGHVKLTNKTYKSVMGPEGFEFEVTAKDIKRGYCTTADGEKFKFMPKDVKKVTGIVRKSAIEFTFTQDATISYVIPTMNEKDKKDAEKILIDCAEEIYNEVIKDYLKDYLGREGQTGFYLYYHNDNRTGAPFSHVHLDVPNLVKLPDGSIRAIEIPELRQKDFHATIDAQYKSKLVEKWNARFENYQLEAYDQDNQKVQNNQMSEIKDWRVAFDDASLAKISMNSQAKELIDKKISEEKVDLFNRVESKRMALQKQFDTKAIPEDDFNDRTEKLNKSYEQQLKHLDSSKNRNEVWTAIKQPKKNAGKELKDLELAKDVAELNLKMKTGDDIGLAFKPKTDEQILDTITNTNPFFTRNGLIIEIAKSRGCGTDAPEIADRIMAELSENRAIVMCGTNGNKQEQFTTFDLIEKEYQNVEMMRKQFATASNKVVQNIDGQIEKISKELRIEPNKEQIEFIKAAFNEKNAEIRLAPPGAGKSLAAQYITKIANAHGYNTIGIAPTGKVANALKNETDVNFASTIDKLNMEIASGKMTLGSNDIVILDEASMVGTRNWNKLLSNLNGAKIIALGDINQIQSVAAGTTLKEFMKDAEIGPQANFLVEIRRQKNEVAKKIAASTSLKDDYTSGKMDEIKKSGSHIQSAIDTMLEHELIKNKFITKTEVIDAITKDYLSNANSYKEKLLLCSTNKTIQRVNDVIQDKRLSTGEIGGDYWGNGKERFYAGDRIVMQKNNKDEYNNGDFGTITAIQGDKITIEFDNKKIKTLSNPKKMMLGYAMSFEKSQGMTVNDTFVLGEVSQNNNQELTNVGFTRNRFNVFVYTTESEYADVVASYKRESSRVSLIDLRKTYMTKATTVAEPNAQVEAHAHQVEQSKLAIQAISEQSSHAQKFLNLLKTKFTEFKNLAPKIFKQEEAPVFIQQRTKPLHINEALKATLPVPQPTPLEQQKIEQQKKKQTITLNL